ncbi:MULTISPECIES: ATP-binding protein [unclassified Brevundimonas]|uniref:ATP-binding protein n=1 Tax=unclassified Brevundimonas TaxID=2622653 RepID=UPI0025B8572D|nr:MULTISPECIES: ATP-binding protein [unclassified Brevundimonas]
MSRADHLTRAAAAAVVMALLVSAPQVHAAPNGDRMPASGPVVVRGSDEAVREYSLTVRRRVLATSMADLERFGNAALAEVTAENLSRLQHVTSVLIEQHEFEAATLWNARLKTMAAKAGNADYLALVEINEVAVRLKRDRDVQAAEIDALIARQKGWLPKAVARGLMARHLLLQEQGVAALRMVQSALSYVPDGGMTEASVGANLWRLAGLAHSQLDDVPGFLRVMHLSEDWVTRTDYPAPGYEPMFNLAMTLGYVGRQEAAKQTLQTYSELARHAGTPVRLSMAGVLCGYIASARDDWSGVLDCYAPFGTDLKAPAPMNDLMLVRRAIAYSRTGQVALARRDIANLREKLDQGVLKMSPQIQRAEAEYMIASGDYRRGINALRDYYVSENRRSVLASSAVMGDIVGDLEAELQLERGQIADHNRTIATLWWMFAAMTLLGAGAMLLLYRQWRMAKALARARDLERDLHARRSQFFADVSHEIRTPLNGVVAMADALSKEQLPPDVAEKVRLIATSSEMLNRLLSDVLDNAKMDAGELTIETEVFDLYRVVRDVEALWRDKAEAKGLTLKLQLDEGENFWVRGDSVRLCEVLNNLISNALKFTPEGKILISVVRLPSERSLFVVTDTGIGFEGASDGRIFERYRQADDSISRKFGGTGLGLSISNKLVKMMGGRLNAASQPGAGSQFWFELPLPSASAPVVFDQPGSAPLPQTGALRILITDDNATNRKILGMLLSSDEYQLQFAVDGREAVQLAASMQFDIILMDVQMPVMDGLEAIRLIRQDEAENQKRPAAILIFSAAHSAEDLKRGMEVGADGHITKPIVLDRLLEAIQGAIQVRERQNEAARLDVMKAAID